MAASSNSDADPAALSVLQQFDQLLDLPAAERAQLLARFAAADPERGRQLEAMLAADSAVSGVLDRRAADLLPPAAVPAAGDWSGRTIGDYLLLDRLGAGGMGEVYRALRRHGGFEQEVALKLLRTGHHSATALARFAREQQILARLTHPGIARLIDGGVAAGTPWLAMELIQGETLLVHADRQRLGLDGRLALVEQIAMAVDYAHRQLVVHRDLKPSNVLVDAQGQPRLLDFGIAKLLDDSDLVHLTASDARIMSPAYAAPEQLHGEPISIATDVYALGLLLYELLVGDLPHRRREATLGELALKLSDHSVERPSVRLRQRAGTAGTVQGIAPRALEGDLDILIGKALAVEPERRYPSAAALAEDLGRYRLGHPIRARPDTLRYRLAKFVRRNRLAVSMAGLALLGLCLGLGSALWQAREARAQAQRAEQVKQFLVAMFAEGEAIGREQAKPRTPLAIVEQAIARARQQFAADPVLADSVVGDLTEIQVNLGAAAAALPEIERVVAFRRSQFGNQDLRLADALSTQVLALFQQGRFPESEPLIVEGEAIYRRHHGEQHKDAVDMRNRLVRVRIAQTRFPEALVLARDVVRLGAQLDGPDSPLQAMRLSNLAVVLLRTRGPADLREARSVLERSLVILERARGPEHASLLFPLNTLGDLLRDATDFDAALPLYQRAAQLAARTLGPEHPRYAVALNRLGDVLHRMERLDEAEQSLRQALAIQQQGGFAEISDTYRRLGTLAQRRNDPEAAVDWFASAHAAGMQTQGAGSAQNWVFLQAQAEALAEAGRIDAARTIMQSALAGLAALGDPARRQLVEARYGMALIEAYANRLDAALDWLQQALELAEPDSRATLELWRAALLLRRAADGDRARAIALLDPSLEPSSRGAPRVRACWHYTRAMLEPQASGATLRALDEALAQAGSTGRLLARWRTELR